MANNITKAQKYVPYLDEAYAAATKTSILDTVRELEFLDKAGTFLVPDMTVSKLGNYDRKTGYSKGTVSNNYTPYQCDYERGKMLGVDVLDDEEAQGLLFANVAGKFIREAVGPELDAYRFARYVELAKDSNISTATLTKDNIIDSLRLATIQLNTLKVKTTDRVLFITTELKGYIDDLDTTKSKAILNKFSDIVEIENMSEFRSAITLDNEDGYDFPEDAKYINFMIVQKDAVMQVVKHAVPKIIPSELNQTSDEDLYAYRIVALNNVYKNKQDGIAVCLSE
jgi:hypothetical protein